MKIQELLKQLTAKEKAQIKAVEVRELDEEDTGHFVAFVDEAEETYDVHIQLNEQSVQQMTCDCGTTQKNLYPSRSCIAANHGKRIESGSNTSGQKKKNKGEANG
ncbi:hypothetical protein M2306_000595 [Myroides gitamensis]|nr:hypothetical protein [Myroides gitamensis]